MQIVVQHDVKAHSETPTVILSRVEIVTASGEVVMTATSLEQIANMRRTLLGLANFLDGLLPGASPCAS